MSDGGGQDIPKQLSHSQQQQLQQHQQNRIARNPNFVRAIAKNSVAQICDTEGFQGFQNSALDAFTDVAVRYVMQLGKVSNQFANESGRTECNVFDVILGLENLGSIQGFLGRSNVVNCSVSGSGVVKEIRQFVSLVEDSPFVFDIPRFPVSRTRKYPSSFLQIGVDPPSHVPPWLPAFPLLDDVDRKDEPLGLNTGEVGVVNVQQQQQEVQEQVKANNGSDPVEVNPFLAPPFAFGEKHVSVIEPPSRVWEGNHVHLMDGYAPDEETARNEVAEVEDGSKDVKLDDRPRVRIKLSNTRRKSLRTFTNVIAQMNGEDETIPVLLERNDENEEKKRRAELILKESMDTPLDTTEL